MSLSASLSKVAANIIKKFGVLVTFSHETTDSFDPATGVKTKTTTTFGGFGVKDEYTIDEINGTTIRKSDVKLLLERVDSEPQIDNSCLIGGTSYRVMDVMPVDPADFAIIYEVQLRT